MLGRLFDGDRILFKKIDSTLRGHPALETKAAIEAVRRCAGAAFGILAPAFPATGRTTLDGRIRVKDQPLETTELWRRDHGYPSADLVEMLASAGIVGEKLPLALIRSGRDALQARFADLASRSDIVAVCDAETDADLVRIAEASLPVSATTFFIGSAGLAHALAAAAPSLPAEPVAFAATGQGTLIVVGSLAEISRAAARQLRDTPGIRYVPVEPAMLLGRNPDLAALAGRVAAGLDAGADVLVEIRTDDAPDLSIGPRLVEALAEALTPAAAHLGGLAATGGETAAALLSRFGVSGIRLVDEIEPGVVLGLTLGALAIPIVTKAGAFGDAGSLARSAEHLRLLRQKENP